MLLTTERHRVDHERTIVPRAADSPALVVRSAHVVALRQRPVIAPGALADRTVIEGERLVTATDISGRAWWIPAEAVWSDAADAEHPQHPRPFGLATGRSTARAIAAGLSDRLGWEAVMAWERGEHLRVLDGDQDDTGARCERLIVLDGRLGHEVPTVVVIGDDLVRWGAAATWSSAVHRALYGDDGSLAVEAELDGVVDALRRSWLDVVGVDLGTALLGRANVVRRSVQLVPLTL